VREEQGMAVTQITIDYSSVVSAQSATDGTATGSLGKRKWEETMAKGTSGETGKFCPDDNLFTAEHLCIVRNT